MERPGRCAIGWRTYSGSRQQIRLRLVLDGPDAPAASELEVAAHRRQLLARPQAEPVLLRQRAHGGTDRASERHEERPEGLRDLREAAEVEGESPLP